MSTLVSSALFVAAAALAQEPPVELSRVASAPQPAASGVVYGRVVSDRTGEPIEMAFVEVIGSPHLFALTDSVGYYRLREVPPGLRQLRARHLSHEPLEVEVLISANSTVSLEFSLEVRPMPLPPLTVVRRRVGITSDSTESPVAGRDPLVDDLLASRMESLGSSPGVAELGLGDALRNPNGGDPIDSNDMVYVRGAAADLKAVYLDGAPVYAPVHLGGLAEAFHPGVLASGVVYSGGASARYDGGLSYVLGLQTRPGTGGTVRTQGSADLASVRTVVEGSLAPESNFLIAGRTVHGVGTRLWSGVDPPSAYNELIGRIDHDLGVLGQVATTFFWNRERVNLDERVLGRDEVHWGNMAGSIRLRSDMPEGELLFTAALGEFDTRLPVAGEEIQFIEGRSLRHRFAADVRQKHRGLHLEYGLSYERHRLRHLATFLAEEGLYRAESDVVGDVAAGYLGTRLSPFGGAQMVVGLRANGFLPDEEGRATMRYSPRMTIGWRPAEGAIVTLGAGRYYQFVQNRESFPSVDELQVIRGPLVEEEEQEPQTALLGVAGATHITARFDQLFGYGVRFGIEGFYKRFQGIPNLAQPQVEASGVELRLGRAGEDWEGSLGYSHGWVWAQDTLVSRGVFSGRHLLDGAMIVHLGNRSQLRFRSTYATGLPYTAIPARPPLEPPATASNRSFDDDEDEDPEEEPAATRRLPLGSYLRLDGEISHSWLAAERSDTRLTVYLRVVNGLDHRDAMFVRLDPDESPDTPPRTTATLLPIVGVRWAF